ncbi:MAG: O-antigen ligase family protein [Candidatus Sericytochromatia bacterium]
MKEIIYSSKTKNLGLYSLLILSLVIYSIIQPENIFYLLIIILGSVTGFFLLITEGLSFYFMLLFIFFGTIASINIGFTLKASQLFSILALGNLFILKKISKENLIIFLPLIIFISSILPSFISPKVFSEFYEASSNLRFLFNLSFLYLISFVTLSYIDTKEKLKKSILTIFISYLLVLVFGIIQQIGFYTGVYNPIDYIGKHSLFVDFYGPFLRISPGTFANEFGEITQVILIFLSNFLIFMRKEISPLTKNFLKVSLLFSLIALVINFTRISWIVYLLYLPIIFFVSKPKFKTVLKICGYICALFGILVYIQIKTNILTLIPIVDRFAELSDLSQNSAGTRLEYWKESYNLFIESPMVGNGFGSTLDTHNVPLELLSGSGLIGFLGFYSLMVFISYKFYIMYKKTNDTFLKAISLSLFLGISSCIIFDFTNHGIFHFILWIIIGLGLATNKIINAKNITYLN